MKYSNPDTNHHICSSLSNITHNGDVQHEQNNYTLFMQDGHQRMNPLHNSPVYSVIQNGNPLPYNFFPQQSPQAEQHMDEDEDYAEPIDSLNVSKDGDRDGDYSTLEPPEDNNYATLEPFIPGSKRNSRSSRDTDDYSHLQY